MSEKLLNTSPQMGLELNMCYNKYGGLVSLSAVKVPNLLSVYMAQLIEWWTF